MESVVDKELDARIEKFLHISSGYGYGYGSGYGDGDGDGYGDGYGDGSGDGYGDGYGYGSGDGSGDGYGDGSGYGYGSGYGDGDGDGIKYYNGNRVFIIDGVQTIIEQVKGNVAKGFIIKEDLTLQPCYVVRAGNYFAHGNTPHKAQSDAEHKALQNEPIESRIERFVSKYPDPDAPIPFKELYDWHNVLTGSCRMGRDSFVSDKGLDTNATYTVRYFIEITKNAYGSGSIRKLADAYGIAL